MPRIIFHIDVNSAFLSWTAVKMVREGKPDIRLVPSVVSGDPSDRRSIITAASIPAKKLGIKTAQPVSKALRTYPQLVIGGGWTGHEALAIAIYSAAKHQGSFEDAIVSCVNHSGDSDSTGAICGNIMGALLGRSAIPSHIFSKAHTHPV